MVFSIILEMRDLLQQGGQNMKRKNFKLGRKFKAFLVSTLLAAVMAITSVPASTAMAADLPAEVATSYSQLTENTIMPRSTTYFIPDQQFSFSGYFTSSYFSVPSACQARLVIAAIGDEPLYIDVMNGKSQREHSITVTPNQSQVHVFNISSGTHYLDFSSLSGSQFTIRLQMYTWDY